MFIVTLTNLNTPFWLRGTTWAYSLDRADKFATAELAQAALDKAKMFMKARIFKAAKVVRS